MRHFFLFLIPLFFPATLVPSLSVAQDGHLKAGSPVISAATRAYDSIRASRIPVLALPDHLRGRSLPPLVDNSKNPYWPGIKDQYMFYTCQEYCGVTYTFGYEINRLKDHPGSHWEDTYPAHYTWNFLNNGQQFTGVNFLQAFDILRWQGQMAQNDYGIDTSFQCSGWPTGYDKYYRGMHNRIREVYAIPINSTEGILTLKNYLYDHLDGSPTGGVACFTTDSWTFIFTQALPPGTPEAGKQVIISWQPQPVHGLTIVGYNDSIRYDINEDGKYTNDTDINDDGVVNARDWEIGGFRVANSYGSWWSDVGFIYVMYSAMANNYEEGGVWNDRVYIVVADTGYQPQLTMKLKMDYNFRDRIKIMAGVSQDPSSNIPEHTMEFPMFSFQGGEFPMQGSYTGGPPGADTIEVGLDVTPLLSWLEPGSAARFFLVAEERDPSGLGNGTIHRVSFINYGAGAAEYVSDQVMVPIANDGTTLLSANLVPVFSKVRVSTASLPPFTAGESYSVALEAEDGRPPYNWSVAESYRIMEKQDSLGEAAGEKLAQQSDFHPYTKIALPFPFPFYGKNYDTLFVNFNGFVSFDPQTVPYPYITDEMAMLRKFPLICPAFTQSYYYPGSPYGVWLRDSGPQQLMVQWKAAMFGGQSQSEINFGLRLFPDGRFDFLYGKMFNPNYPFSVFTGVSKGDEINHNLEEFPGDADLSYQCVSYRPPQIPGNIQVSPEGLLVITPPDSTMIYDVGVRVADANNLSDVKYFQLSDGLDIGYDLLSGNDNLLRFGQPASFKLFLTNTGMDTIRNLSLLLRNFTPGVEMIDSLESLGILEPGETGVIGNAFSFSLTSHLHNGSPVDMQIRVASDGDQWKRPVLMNVSAVDLEFGQTSVFDGDNNLLDPGEYADLVIGVTNRSDLGTTNLEVSLESLDTLVTIQSDPLQVIDTFYSQSDRPVIYQVSASRVTPPGHKAAMKMVISGKNEVPVVHQFQLQVGKKAVALALLSSSNTSLLAMEEELDSLQVPYEVFTALPFGYNDFSAIFLMLGTANSGSHVLTNQEGSDLAAYLNSGGNIYMEGLNTWNNSNSTPLHYMFRQIWDRVSYFSYRSISGVQGTFTDSLVLATHGTLGGGVYNFRPVEPAYITLVSNSTPPRNLEITNDGGTFRAIGTFVGFGSMADSLYPSGRLSLMKRYIGFFGIDLSGLHPFFHTATSQACIGKPVTFIDDSYDNIISRQWEFPGAIPASSTEKDPVVTYGSAGKYDVKLTISDGVNTRSVFKEQYITVMDCTGLDEEAEMMKIGIYPNPAKESTWIVLPGSLQGPVKLELFDFTGRKCRDITIRSREGSPRYSLDLRGLPGGIYMLMVTAPEFRQTVKIVTD